MSENNIYGYAVIGTDGIRPVVWGLGRTEEDAEEDAECWLDDAQGLSGCKTVSLTKAQYLDIYEDIYEGNIDAEELGLS